MKIILCWSDTKKPAFVNIYTKTILEAANMIATCRYFIIMLLLFLLCAMAQNAPVGLQKRETSTRLSSETQRFYCTSVLLKNLVKFMVQVRKWTQLCIFLHVHMFIGETLCGTTQWTWQRNIQSRKCESNIATI